MCYVYKISAYNHASRTESTILAKSPLDTFKKLWKAIAISAFQSLRLLRTPSPSPLKYCCSVPETFGVIVHKNFLRYRMYFSQKPNCLGGGVGRLCRPD